MAWKMDWSSQPICFQHIPAEPLFGIPVHGSYLPVMELPQEHLSKGLRGKKIRIFMLLGFFLPPGNLKAVPAGFMIKRALEAGTLKPGGTLVEPTSGGMGIALAYHGAKADLKTIAIVSDDLPFGKGVSLSRHGATVLRESEVARALNVSKEAGSTELARLYARSIGGVFLNQYANPWNPESYEVLLAEALWEGIGYASMLVAPIGSRGILLGLGQGLRKLNPKLEVVGTMPYHNQSIDGTRTWERQQEVKHDLTPLTPHVLERIDEITAKAVSDRLNRIGIPCGPSGGAGFGTAEHMLLTRVEEGTLEDIAGPEGDVRVVLPLHDTRYPYDPQGA